MADPYQSPETQVFEAPETFKKHSVAIAIGLYAVPFVGVLIAKIYLVSAWGVLAQDESVTPLEVMTQVILIGTISTMLCLFGFVKLCYVIFRDGERRKGFFWTVLTISAIYGFVAFPIGFLFGGAMIGILLYKRAEFFQA